MDISSLVEQFKVTYNTQPQIVRAPGRVNIIGEHTDYNDGFVLPFPIAKAIYFAASKRTDNEIHIHAIDLNKKIIISLDEISLKEQWTRFFIGSLRVIQEDQLTIGGFNVMINGDIPFGAGISSSSALTCGFLYTIKRLFNLNYSKKDIVFMASRAENGTGVNGGKMDQFAICMGQKNKAILLDCKDYSYKLIESEIPEAKWYLFNTNVEHNLAETEYNDRREDCDSAIELIMKENPDVTSIRDLTMEDLNHYIDLLSKKQYDRLCHVIEENARVHSMAEALAKHNLEMAGQLLYESHRSLSVLYEVSCEELDFIVSNLQKRKDCIGARMMGGGFGGSVIALLKKDTLDFDTLRENYKESFDLEMDIIPVKSTDGINVVDY